VLCCAVAPPRRFGVKRDVYNGKITPCKTVLVFIKQQDVSVAEFDALVNNNNNNNSWSSKTKAQGGFAQRGEHA
jgi:hypothetical protein